MKITIDWVRGARERGAGLSALTAYDYPTARLLDEAGIEILLVGDSVGMVMLGFPDTTLVTLDHMRHHTGAVARAQTRALVVADLPFQTYLSPEQAVQSAQSLREVGAEAVKLEGGLEREAEIRAILEVGIPVMGHLGMLPQSIHEEGGVYRIKGKTLPEREYLQKSMDLFARLGVFAVVLELVKADVAQSLTEHSTLPTIGIGSGTGCTGQILVTPDLIGLSPWFRPKFVTPLADVATEIKRAAANFKDHQLR